MKQGVFLTLAVILAGCGAFPPAVGPESAEIFIAAEWNVQALFDGEDSGGEYGEYRPEAGWTAEKYTARLTAISRAILAIAEPKGTGAKVPDLIGLVELENSSVLDDLGRGSPGKRGFSWTAFAKNPGSPLGIGVLSRVPLSDVRIHSITEGKDTAPRPVLELKVEARGKPLVFLLCHWKSKLGGDGGEAQRRASARIVKRRIRELKETEPETPVIVMGDLNENHDEFYRGGQGISALLPDDEGAAALAAQNKSADDFLVLSGEMPPRARFFPEGTPALFTPWPAEKNSGSYYYRKNWETIDHFLLSDRLFDGSGWEYQSFRLLNAPPFTKPGGRPDSYSPKSGRGLSDHLPLLLFLRKKD